VGIATTIPRELHFMPERNWVPIGLACASAAVILSAALTYGPSLVKHSPLGLEVHREGQQLRITWNRSAAGAGANLEIIDGSQHTAIFIPRSLANVTYRAQTTDVEIRFGDRSGSQMARFLLREPESLATLKSEFAKAREEASALRVAMSRHSLQVDRLQQTANRLFVPPPKPPSPGPTTWWR
jgi:hypothetical protein